MTSEKFYDDLCSFLLMLFVLVWLIKKILKRKETQLFVVVCCVKELACRQESMFFFLRNNLTFFFSRHYQKLFDRLSPLFNIAQNVDLQENPDVVDNACGALARIILSDWSVLPLKDVRRISRFFVPRVIF